jgi:anhydro-N-acetylmuramic acid kinase
MLNVLGLMSGTSMDGVDAAVLETDGETIGAKGPTHFRPYSEGERTVLRRAIAEARTMSDRSARPGAVAEGERIVTDAHAEAVEELQRRNPDLAIDLIGFHGQTVFHAPRQGLTVQIGNGRELARRLGIPVVFDLRAADVAAGGEGAPLVPVYHRALVERAKLGGTVVVVNIGGVANITRIAADGSLVAGDTGPGNALIDDFILRRTGAPMDRDGAHAARGKVDRSALARLMDNPWFDRPMPKSLDRDAFSAEPVAELSTEDGAATLAAFTSDAILKGIVMAGGADRIVVAGGGASNGVLMQFIGQAAGRQLGHSQSLGWSADFLEAEAFAYLAARSRRGLPLTFPGTTGVRAPMTGGVFVEP